MPQYQFVAEFRLPDWGFGLADMAHVEHGVIDNTKWFPLMIVQEMAYRSQRSYRGARHSHDGSSWSDFSGQVRHQEPSQQFATQPLDNLPVITNDFSPASTKSKLSVLLDTSGNHDVTVPESAFSITKDAANSSISTTADRKPTQSRPFPSTVANRRGTVVYSSRSGPTGTIYSEHDTAGMHSPVESPLAFGDKALVGKSRRADTTTTNGKRQRTLKGKERKVQRPNAAAVKRSRPKKAQFQPGRTDNFDACGGDSFNDTMREPAKDVLLPPFVSSSMDNPASKAHPMKEAMKSKCLRQQKTLLKVTDRSRLLPEPKLPVATRKPVTPVKDCHRTLIMQEVKREQLADALSQRGYAFTPAAEANIHIQMWIQSRWVELDASGIHSLEDLVKHLIKEFGSTCTTPGNNGVCLPLPVEADEASQNPNTHDIVVAPTSSRLEMALPVCSTESARTTVSAEAGDTVNSYISPPQINSLDAAALYAAVARGLRYDQSGPASGGLAPFKTFRDAIDANVSNQAISSQSTAGCSTATATAQQPFTNPTGHEPCGLGHLYSTLTTRKRGQPNLVHSFAQDHVSQDVMSDSNLLASLASNRSPTEHILSAGRPPRTSHHGSGSRCSSENAQLDIFAPSTRQHVAEALEENRSVQSSARSDPADSVVWTSPTKPAHPT